MDTDNPISTLVELMEEYTNKLAFVAKIILDQKSSTPSPESGLYASLAEASAGDQDRTLRQSDWSLNPLKALWDRQIVDLDALANQVSGLLSGGQLPTHQYLLLGLKLAEFERALDLMKKARESLNRKPLDQVRAMFG